MTRSRKFLDAFSAIFLAFKLKNNYDVRYLQFLTSREAPDHAI